MPTMFSKLLFPLSLSTTNLINGLSVQKAPNKISFPRLHSTKQHHLTHMTLKQYRERAERAEKLSKKKNPSEKNGPKIVGADEEVSRDEVDEIPDASGEAEGGFHPVDLDSEMGTVSHVVDHVLKDINREREKDGEKDVSFTHEEIEGAWVQAESDGEKYVLCLSAEVDGERRFMRVGAIRDEVKDSLGNLKERVALTSVSDPLAVLGSKVVADESEDMKQAMQLENVDESDVPAPEEPVDWEMEFPCNSETRELGIFSGHGAGGGPVSGGTVCGAKNKGSTNGAVVPDEVNDAPATPDSAEEASSAAESDTTTFVMSKKNHPYPLGGVILGDKMGLAAISKKKTTAEKKNMPESYDSRAEIPDCAAAVKNQGGCGSCYAFAAVSMASERHCIHNQKHSFLQDSFLQQVNGKKYHSLLSFLSKKRKAVTDLSQQELVSCGSSTRDEYKMPFCIQTGSGPATTYTSGCDGAPSLTTLAYLHYKGLPSANCASYVSGGGDPLKHMDADTQSGAVPKCAALESKQCHSEERAKYKMSFPIKIAGGDVNAMQQAIFEGGPIQAGMTVYKSFFAYKGGDAAIKEKWGNDMIYWYDCLNADDHAAGGHAVSLHGWGKGKMADGNPADFWHGRNSWGEDWGLKGLFRIKKGANTVGIEGDVYYVNADPQYKDPNLDGECLKVRDGKQKGECLIENTCQTQIRSGAFSYLRFNDGSSTSDCGSFVSSSSHIQPGEDNAIRLERAVQCAVQKDEFVEDVPEPSSDENAAVAGGDKKALVTAGLSYVDTTEAYRSYGYTCLVTRAEDADMGKKLHCRDGNTISAIHLDSTGIFVVDDDFCRCATDLYEE